MNVIVWIQVVSFAVLGTGFLRAGEWRLGTAQLLLAAVQAVIYTGRGLA